MFINFENTKKYIFYMKRNMISIITFLQKTVRSPK